MNKNVFAFFYVVKKGTYVFREPKVAFENTYKTSVNSHNKHVNIWLQKLVPSGCPIVLILYV